MQVGFFDKLCRATSDDRLKPYRHRNTAGNNLKIYASYVWNIALSESIYPALHGFEVTLRNSVNDAATAAFGNRWFDDLTAAREKDTLEKLKRNLGVQALDIGQFVSGVTLGFWVALFTRRYEQVLWPRLLSEAFPNMPRRMRTRKNLYARLDKIRNLRNRIYHYEPVWHWNDISEQHHSVLETIGWMNGSMLAVVKMLDRFPEVHRLGLQNYEKNYTDAPSPPLWGLRAYWSVARSDCSAGTKKGIKYGREQ